MIDDLQIYDLQLIDDFILLTIDKFQISNLKFQIQINKFVVYLRCRRR